MKWAQRFLQAKTHREVSLSNYCNIVVTYSEQVQPLSADFPFG
jgi:hypothetical protein